MRCVVIAGGEIKDYKKMKNYIKPRDYIIACDSGVNHLSELGILPDLIVGDFDSYRDTLDYSCEIITLPVEKDETDSFFAIKQAISRGYDEITLLGGTGRRFDHTMANISALCFIKSQGAFGEIIDDYGRYFVLDGDTAVIKRGECQYFSIIPLTFELHGITITGAKFPLKNADADMNYLYTTSNEIVENECKISIKSGKAIVFLAVD